MKNIVMITVYVIGQLNYSNAASSRLDDRITTDDICPISETTLEKVDRCPEYNESIRERSERKNCAMYGLCQRVPLVYHCVRYENDLVEVCAPKEIITGNCCAEFIKEFGRVVADYSKPCDECPFHYQSNTALKYPTCQCHSHQNGRSKRDAECNRKFEEATGKDPKVSSGNPMMAYILVPIAVVMIFLGGGLFAFWKKKQLWNNPDEAESPGFPMLFSESDIKRAVAITEVNEEATSYSQKWNNFLIALEKNPVLRSGNHKNDDEENSDIENWTQAEGEPEDEWKRMKYLEREVGHYYKAKIVETGENA